MSEVHAARRERLRDRCAAAGAAAALVSRPANVRYLSGCSPEGSVLLVGPGPGDVLVHRRRPSGDFAQGRAPDDVRSLVLPSPEGDPVVAAADLARQQGAEALAVEERHLTVARHRAIGPAAPGLRLCEIGRAHV